MINAIKGAVLAYICGALAALVAMAVITLLVKLIVFVITF